MLTDSFGASYSMCRNYMLLESGNPVSIKLQQGICEITEENDVTFTPFDAENQKNGESTTSSDDVDKLREKKNVFNLGTNYKITNNKTYVYSNKANLPWQPVLENGNSLEKNSAESSRSLQSYAPGEIYEPILKDRPQPKPHTGRSFNVDGEKKKMFAEEEIMEPILKATTARSRKTKQVPIESSTTRDNSYFNVQLLPFRLGEIFERAERYARETLLPLISEQAPRFFGFGIDREEPNQRRPKYIPKIGENLLKNETIVRERRINLPPILNDTVFIVDSSDDEYDTEFNDPNDNNSTEIKRSDLNESQNVVINEPRGTKNILSLLRVREKRNTSTPFVKPFAESRRFGADHGRSMSSSNYYTNSEAIKNDDSLKVVRISLPTYHPPSKALPLFSPLPKARRLPFPYQFEIPADPL